MTALAITIGLFSFVTLAVVERRWSARVCRRKAADQAHFRPTVILNG